jgi:hypothetical protein
MLTRVIGIVYRTLSAHVLRNARLTRAIGATRVVTLVQRFGSALSPNIHCVLPVAVLAEAQSERILQRRPEVENRARLRPEDVTNPKRTLLGHSRRIQRSPAPVRGYFRNRHIRYAA